MFRKLPEPQARIAAWLTVAAWTAIIFLTIPFARTIQKMFEKAYGSDGYLIAAGIAGLFMTVVILIFIFRRHQHQFFKKLIWLLLIMASSTWLIRFQLQSPPEAIHFFEYGVLSFLLFCAWRNYIRDYLIYPISLFTLVIIASTDEFIQWLVPGRYWDFRDIRLNLLAGLIIQLFIALVIKPSTIHSVVDRWSVRLLCRVSWLTLLLLGFAFSNTPSRVDLYATRIPFLQFLSNNESVMNEFGYRHVDPEIGVFYSRFPKAELQRIDHARGEEAGETLRRFHVINDYREFLQTFTSSVDPFLHEMRVHLHRRDHYYDTAWKYEDSDPKKFVFHLTVSDRENKILEKYFPTVLKNSGYEFKDYQQVRVRKHADPLMRYTSPVSDHLVTMTTEFEFWLVIIVLAVIVGIIRYRYGQSPGDKTG